MFASGILSQLLDLPAPSVQVQQWALSVGKSSRSASLLAKLAAHPSLDPEVDAALAQVTMAPVRAAWLARPQRDPGEVRAVLLEESRTTVLKAMANQSALSPEVYAHLSETLGVTALPVLIANAAAPIEARKRAAQRLGELYATHALPAPELEPVLREFPDIARTMFDSTKSAPLAAACLGHMAEVCPDDIDRAVHMIEAQFANTSPKWVHNTIQTLESLVYALSTQRVPSDQRTRLRTCTESYVGILYSHWRVANIVAAIDSLTDLDGNSANSIPARIRAAKTDKAALKAFHEGVAQGLSSFVLLLPAMESPRVSAEAFASMLDAVAFRGDWDQFLMLWRLVSAPDKLAVLYTRFHWLDLDQGLSRLADPAQGLTEVAACLTQWHRSTPAAVFSSRFFSPNILLRMPARGLARTVAELDQQTLQALEQALLFAVTTDEALATLCALGDEYEGSLEDLLTVSVQL